jgi:hypothetical protein
MSLSDGQSYQNVLVYEDDDIAEEDKIFEEWTKVIIADGERILLHLWKIKVIHLDKTVRSTKNSIKADRLILDGNISYQDISIIPHPEFEEAGVPHYFIGHIGGIAGQLTYSCQGGTYITHDTNVSSIIMRSSRRTGVSAASAPMISKSTLPLKLARTTKIKKDQK